MNEQTNISWGFLATAFLVLATIFAIRIIPKLMAGVPFITPKGLKAEMDDKKTRDLLVIDVRSPGEFAGGHVPGAMNLPVDDLATRLAEIPPAELDALKDTPVYLICASGSRAAQAARKMKKAGFTKLTVVDGGTAKWQRQGLPIR